MKTKIDIKALIILALVAVLLLGTAGCSKCTKSKIKNVLLPLAEEPIISFRFLFHTGSMDDPQGKNGLTALTASMLADASTKKNSYKAILDKLFPMASGYNVYVDREYTVFTGKIHRDNLSEYYVLFKEALLEPAFLEEDFNRIKTQMTNNIKTLLRYGNDEELGKAVFKSFVYAGTPYENNPMGKESDVEKITLEDVKKWYSENFTQDRLIIGLAGNYPECFIGTINKDFAVLPETSPTVRGTVNPQKIEGYAVRVVEKETESTGIHIGFPIGLMRSDPDFHALFLANSWFGVHRNSASHLYDVIREKRGMNYGDYSYIEDFPNGGRRMFPPTNVYKKPQLFEIWIRPVENNNRLFALRAAVRELKKLVENGLSQDDFNLTKSFLSKNVIHFAPTTSERLGYLIDDGIFGMKENYLENFKKNIDALTLEQVNAAIKKHLQFENLKIVFVTKGAEQLKEELLYGTVSPIIYRTPKPPEILAEDKSIESFPVPVKPGSIVVMKVDEVFK